MYQVFKHPIGKGFDPKQLEELSEKNPEHLKMTSELFGDKKLYELVEQEKERRLAQK